jgi:four helix bundle protein
MERENALIDKSYKFALRIIKLSEYLREESGEFVLYKQILRSGTSIGANAEEANGAQSERDFLTKITIAYKEARETHYWIRLLRDSGKLPAKAAESVLNDCDELLKILGSVKASMVKKLKTNA